MKVILNTLIIGSIILILYAVVGHGFVIFYFKGKTEILETAEQINELCNANGSCPTNPLGWQVGEYGRKVPFKNSMLYIADPNEVSNDSHNSKKYLTFRLVYQFFMPDHWFEVQGGVNKEITSDWQSR